MAYVSGTNVFIAAPVIGIRRQYGDPESSLDTHFHNVEIGSAEVDVGLYAARREDAQYLSATS